MRMRALHLPMVVVVVLVAVVLFTQKHQFYFAEILEPIIKPNSPKMQCIHQTPSPKKFRTSAHFNAVSLIFNADFTNYREFV